LAASAPVPIRIRFGSSTYGAIIQASEKAPFMSNPSNFDNINSRMLELGGDAQLTTVKLKL
jgi:hypothetical protein